MRIYQPVHNFYALRSKSVFLWLSQIQITICWGRAKCAIECSTWFLSWAISLLLGALLFRWSNIICASARRTLVLFRSFFSLFSVSTSLWLTCITKHHCYASLHFYSDPPSEPVAPLETQKQFLSNQNKWHTLNRTHLCALLRDQRQRSTWSWVLSSLDSSSLLSRNTFCLSSYSSSSCTSICFSCKTYEWHVRMHKQTISGEQSHA